VTTVWADRVLRQVVGWVKVPVETTILRIFKEVLNQACKISFDSARKAICGWYERAPFFFGLKPLALPS
jgi:hypothetical protein